MTQDSDTKKPLISFREASELYENGKHRRYELLFAVNGGAFAIAKLVGEHKSGLGKLHFAEIAVGMILFTSAMVYDIFCFGLKWHELANEIALANQIDEYRLKHYEIFSRKGQVVLLVIGLLLCVGWLLVAWQS
jgi:hypothetical protein